MTHILIAEDDFDIRELLTELLESSGYQVTSAANGMEALKIHQTAAFNLIMLDIMMPFFDGFEVAQQIRKSSQSPIIFLTALQDEETQVKGLILGLMTTSPNHFRYVSCYAESKPSFDAFKRMLKKNSLFVKLPYFRQAITF